MTLVFEIEYLSGVSYAAVGPDSEMPEWPPQPDRIFSALVATWAARGQDAGEEKALRWLEKLPPPRILATDAEPRTSAIAFVPPNDPRSDRQKNAKGVLPLYRSRQARRFPAARPHEPIARLLWTEADPANDAFVQALDRLARDTAYVGHSASLTRCRFFRESAAIDLGEVKEPARCVYGGRFKELREAFDARRRPLPGVRFTTRREEGVARSNPFAQRWLLLEHVDGEMPDLRASALVAKAIRDALVAGYGQIVGDDRVPAEVSGRAANGDRSRVPHPAIVPLAFAGFPHADGHVMGFALIPPRDSTLLEDAIFKTAFRKVAPIDEDDGRRLLALSLDDAGAAQGVTRIRLAPMLEAPARSMDPALYLRPARLFATVTPIVLDRHLKEPRMARQEEIEAQIADACINFGLPRPVQVVADKHSTIAGAASAQPSGRSPAWLRWRLPSWLASRPLTHAVIRFASPVEGPVLLGAGRYLGLGLCRSIDEDPR
ncbi:MAG TPA: type I-U CRISPR-associated protein Csb2 [Terriglobales bacterium]|nr:type I-U CRISPR-associated protein Csb2 [Terriglobales bacterium]